MTDPRPLLTSIEAEHMRLAREAGAGVLDVSLDLAKSTTQVILGEDGWVWQERTFPYVQHAKERTVYYWGDGAFRPVSRYGSSLVKLVPTPWGPPTFEIDGIKMLPSAQVSPYEDAERKVSLIQPRGKCVLDTCGGLGYFAAWCLRGAARQVQSYEKNPDVAWLRSMNPWSPSPVPELALHFEDVLGAVEHLPTGSFDAALHDPPRFGIAGDLYSQRFYDQLARVLRRRGRLFHYTGEPNKLSSGRDVPQEVSKRLKVAGFETTREGDGILAVMR